LPPCDRNSRQDGAAPGHPQRKASTRMNATADSMPPPLPLPAGEPPRGQPAARRLGILDLLLAAVAGAALLAGAIRGLQAVMGTARMAAMMQDGGDAVALIALFTVFFSVIVAAVWIGVARHGRAAPGLLGLRRFSRHWWWMAPACILVLSVALEEGVLRLVQAAFDIDLTPQTAQVITGLAKTLPQALGATLAIGLIGPFAEELLFRGLVYGCTERYFGGYAAWAVSSILFALAHAEPAHIVLVLPLGVLLGWLRRRSASLWPGIIAHVANNTLVVWWAYLMS
jgi:membrane protease YdiL (CAAX protease family)